MDDLVLQQQVQRSQSDALKHGTPWKKIDNIDKATQEVVEEKNWASSVPKVFLGNDQTHGTFPAEG